MSASLNPLLGFAAGALTILSPCVLPLLPVIFVGAVQRHKWGALVLSAGLILTFTGSGLLLALFGTSLDLDGEWFRWIAAAGLIAMGLVLVVPAAQDRLSRLLQPLAGWGHEQQARFAGGGLAGQFAIGALLGLVWSPCVGPTLGAATLLAAQGEDLAAVALVMTAFAAGIATVMLVIGLVSREVLARRRGGLVAAGQRGRKWLGGALAIVGLLVLSGMDHVLSGMVLSVSPDWLVDLTTAV
jgi:cytochrome c-type biogenesis protein